MAGDGIAAISKIIPSLPHPEIGICDNATASGFSPFQEEFMKIAVAARTRFPFHQIIMKTLKIDDTVYNLAYLVSFKYKAKSKDPAGRSKKSGKEEPTPATGTLKSDSSLVLHFLNCKPVLLKKDKADSVWSKLATTLNLEKP